MGRWDYLYEAKAVPVVEYVLDEVAKRVATELRQWPLDVEELDPTAGAKYAELLAPDSRRPADAVFREALRLAGFELTREFERLDDYLRNHRYRERGVAEADRTALLFIQRWVEEQLLGVLDATEGRVKRAQLATCLPKIEQRLLGGGVLLM